MLRADGRTSDAAGGVKSSLKDFDVLSRLGKGSFGTVYKVRRRVDNQIYVMKQINIAAMDKRQRQDAIQEVNILASLDCPYIVKYFDSFLENDNLNIVMEYCERGDLNGLLKGQNGKPLPEARIWKFYIQIALGLHYIHQRKILHRDIKAMNVFLTKDDGVRIGDLGVAKVLSTSSNFAHTMVGTPYYLSPELCEEKPYNEKSDVWALGCVLYEMCTLRHPFDANNQGALILKIIKGRYASIGSAYSSDLAELVDGCLARDYHARPSLIEILSKAAVQARAKSLAIALPADLPPPSSVRSSARRSQPSQAQSTPRDKENRDRDRDTERNRERDRDREREREPREGVPKSTASPAVPAAVPSTGPPGTRRVRAAAGSSSTAARKAAQLQQSGRQRVVKAPPKKSPTPTPTPAIANNNNVNNNNININNVVNMRPANAASPVPAPSNIIGGGLIRSSSKGNMEGKAIRTGAMGAGRPLSAHKRTSSSQDINDVMNLPDQVLPSYRTPQSVPFVPAYIKSSRNRVVPSVAQLQSVAASPVIGPLVSSPTSLTVLPPLSPTKSPRSPSNQKALSDREFNDIVQSSVDPLPTSVQIQDAMVPQKPVSSNAHRKSAPEKITVHMRVDFSSAAAAGAQKPLPSQRSQSCNVQDINVSYDSASGSGSQKRRVWSQGDDWEVEQQKEMERERQREEQERQQKEEEEEEEQEEEAEAYRNDRDAMAEQDEEEEEQEGRDDRFLQSAKVELATVETVNGEAFQHSLPKSPPVTWKIRDSTDIEDRDRKVSDTDRANDPDGYPDNTLEDDYEESFDSYHDEGEEEEEEEEEEAENGGQQADVEYEEQQQEDDDQLREVVSPPLSEEDYVVHMSPADHNDDPHHSDPEPYYESSERHIPEAYRQADYDLDNSRTINMSETQRERREREVQAQALRRLHVMLDRESSLTHNIQRNIEDCVRQVSRPVYSELYAFFKEKAESEHELTEEDEEEINRFVYGRVPTEKAEVIFTIYKLLHLETELRKCQDAIDDIISVNRLQV